MTIQYSLFLPDNISSLVVVDTSMWWSTELVKLNSWDRGHILMLIHIQPMFLNLDNSLDKPTKMLPNTEQLTM